MLTLLAWILFIGVVWSFAFYNTSSKFWIPGLAVLLLVYSYFAWISVIALIVFWAIWAGLTLFMVYKTWRINLFTKPFLNWFRQQQPALTAAEQQVLDAGGLWFEKEFFTGKPDWRKLKEIPAPQLSVEEQSFLDNQVEHLCSMLNDWDIVNRLHDLPEAVWDYLKKEKFFGLVVDKKYGGHGFSAVAHSAIVTKIASRCYSAALTVMVPNSLGPAELLHHYGTEEQKNYYLPRLATGDEIPCFALTAPTAGSDATSIIDSGVVCKGQYEGQEIIGIRLNFNKRYITLAPITTLIGLAFKLYDPDNLIGENKNIGITLALVPAHLPGIEKGKRHRPLNLSFMNGPVRGKDVFIPMDFIIGGEKQRGQGWQMLLECLAVGRGISLPALSTATTQLCYRTTGAYALARQQFKRSIGEFDGVKEALARIGAMTYLTEAVRLFTAQAVDAGSRPSVASAITKYHLTEIARKAVLDAMDIHGGRAIQQGPNNYLANIYNGMPTSITVEGANILTRNLIIFGQGAMRAHPFVRAEIAASRDPNDPDQVKEFDNLLMTHLGLILSQVSRLMVYGFTQGAFIKAPMINNKHYKQLMRMSCAFALMTDVTMAVMGTELKIRETISARLGDIVSYLYLATACLKHFENHEASSDEQVFVDWCIDFCLHQIQNAFVGLWANFPKPWVARLMKFLIFPLGLRYTGPRDRDSFRIATLMQSDLELRDRLTEFCYANHEVNDLTGRMDVTMRQLIQTAPLLHKVMAAVKNKQIEHKGTLAELIQNAYNVSVLTKAESDALLAAEQMRDQVIQVDEFNAALNIEE